MKPVIIFSAFLLSLVSSAQQNKKKYFFYFQGGYKSSLFIKEAARHRFHSGTESHSHKCIVFNTGIQFLLAEGWRVGASFTYDHFGTKHRSLEFSNLSYLVRCDRIWKEKRNYSVYSGLMIGLTKTRQFEEEIEARQQTAPCYHIYLFGAEYKMINNLFMDMNAGWGVAGIINMGAKFRF